MMKWTFPALPTFGFTVLLNITEMSLLIFGLPPAAVKCGEAPEVNFCFIWLCQFKPSSAET